MPSDLPCPIPYPYPPPVENQDPAPAAYISSQVELTFCQMFRCFFFFGGVQRLITFFFSEMNKKHMVFIGDGNHHLVRNIFGSVFPIIIAKPIKEDTLRYFGNELSLFENGFLEANTPFVWDVTGHKFHHALRI